MKNRHKIWFIVTIILFVIGILFFLSFLIPKSEKISFTEIQKMEKENHTGLVYVFSSRKTDCSNCTKIKRFLDKKNINYFVYDISQVDEKEYSSFTQYMHINKKTFGLPAIIYIKNGKKQNYIMNIKSEEQLQKYIDDYELKNIN